MMISIKQVTYWFSLVVSSTVVVMNVMVLSRHDFLAAPLLAAASIRNDFVQQQPRKPLPQDEYRDPRMIPGVYSSPSSNNNQREYRRSRTLIGIFSSNTRNDCTYRKRHRELFRIWNDTRVCTLGELAQRPERERKHCQLVYTFVIGAGDADSPTQIVNASVPLYRTKKLASKFPDVNHDDVTLLNIKENMNDGKSPTFFYFASTVLERYNLDYAMKLDGDSILHLHDWFLFAHYQLPPRPFARGMVGGALRHKAFWPAPANPADSIRLESYWQEQYEGIHLYLAGQCYFMSLDLCRVVSHEAPTAGSRLAPGGYLEGHEDHDVSSMAFRSSNPIHVFAIGKSQRFWEHPVKGQPRWDRIRVRELARMAGEVFEGKQLRLYRDE